MHCSYTKEVMEMIRIWSNGLVRLPSQAETITKDWWNALIQECSRAQRRKTTAIVMVALWNVWKERNQRVFEDKTSLPSHVFSLIKEELKLIADAHGRNGVDFYLHGDH
uniref:Uncharacterized protein n=1 Tax=Arundo donax TaxID=35708 RepID=A0A0A8Z6H5_ARUDO